VCTFPSVEILFEDSSAELLLMKIARSWRWVLAYQCVGFGLLIAFAWLEEIEGLPQFLFGGGKHIHDWRDSAMATLIIVYVAAIIIGLTLRLLGRLQHLEDLLRVCAWCRKIGYKGKWLRMEDYFAQGHNLYTTHGMCPDCLKKVQEDTGLVKKLEIKAPRPTPEII
jgi:hypothetical protein